MITKLKLLLDEIKLEMQRTDFWQSKPPAPEAFLSDQPFSIDTMNATEWLQWVFLARMNALIEANAVLPVNFSLHPYFEGALKELPNVEILLSLIKQLDELVVTN